MSDKNDNVSQCISRIGHATCPGTATMSLSPSTPPIACPLTAMNLVEESLPSRILQEVVEIESAPSTSSPTTKYDCSSLGKFFGGGKTSNA